MKFSFNHIFGAATGPAIQFAPQARLAAGLLIFPVCIIAKVDTPAGIAISLITLTTWILFCRPPARLVLKIATFGLAMFLPFFLLTPFLPNSGNTYGRSMLIPWRIFFRGMMTLMTAVVTLSTLRFSELRTGLHRLPIPNIVAHIVLQIIHQTLFMYQESVSIANALKLRGATSGLRIGIQMILMLPQVWLPRVIHRAERIAMAMDIRGYAHFEFHDDNASRCSIKDFLLIGIALFLLLTAIVSREVTVCPIRLF
jgi:energy-coupling factor transporter transmembrane protein EcfT